MTYSIQNSEMGEGGEWQHVNIRVEREETVQCLQEGTWWHQAEKRKERSDQLDVQSTMGGYII